MAARTPNRNYPVPDENAVPPQSGTQAFLILKQAITAVDFDVNAAFDSLSGKAASVHNHTVSQVEGLSDQLDSKMASDKTFTLDDLLDVDGASQAPVGYVLVKTATGWLPQSALAAVGNHEHSIAQVAGLTDALDLKQGISGKGAANGYAALDSDGKVPSTQLPSLTTTATVGAALAGANGKAVPADGDRFAGILSGVSTVFHTTWGNIKAGLKAYFDTLYTPRNAGDDFFMHANFSLNGLYFYNGAKTQAYTLWSSYNMTPSEGAAGSTMAKRDASGDITARLFRSTFANEVTMRTAFAMRSDAASDNYTRFVTWDAVAAFLADNGGIATKIETRAGAHAAAAVANRVMADRISQAGYVGGDINNPYMMHDGTTIDQLVSRRNIGLVIGERVMANPNIGCVAFMRHDGRDVANGDQENGASLKYTDAAGRGGPSPGGGSWRCLGSATRGVGTIWGRYA